MEALMNITPEALKRLQVLYRQYEAHSLDVGDASREARLTWAGSQIGRAIASFSDLTVEEGIRLIDGLQRAIGRKMPSKTPRRRMSKTAAQKAGTEGRGDQIHAEATMVSADDLTRIQTQLTRLGWDQQRLERFLLSTRSPLKGRTQIRTLGDTNKVYWALKHIPAARTPQTKEQQIAC
jgi:hypothetical protein